MTNISQLVSSAGSILIAGFFGLLTWKLLTGEISLDYLLYGVRPDQSKFFSPGRAQLLFVTILTAGEYLIQVIHDPTRLPQIPTGWVVALGGSQAIYLGGKAQSMLFGIRDLVNRRQTHEK